MHCTKLSACQAKQNGCVDESYAPRVLLFPNSTGWPDHERIPLGPSACQDACSLPQLQVSNSGHDISNNGSQQQMLHSALSLCMITLHGCTSVHHPLVFTAGLCSPGMLHAV